MAFFKGKRTKWINTFGNGFYLAGLSRFKMQAALGQLSKKLCDSLMHFRPVCLTACQQKTSISHPQTNYNPWFGRRNYTYHQKKKKRALMEKIGSW